MSVSVKFGVVGCGHIGKRHCENILKMDNAELWGVCDTQEIDSDTLEAWGLESQHTDFEQFVRCPFDCIVIATPNHLHKEMVCMAVEYGKAVLAEKPLTLSKADCHTIDEMAKELDGRIFMDMPMRYLPAIQKVTKMIHKGEAGKIHSINMNILWNRNEGFYSEAEWRGNPEKVGSILFNENIHHIDLAQYWIGDIWPISMVEKNIAHEYLKIADFYQCQYGGLGGIVGAMTFTTSAPVKSFGNSITIIAEKAIVNISGMMFEKLRINDEEIEFDVNMNHFAQVFEEIVKELNGESSEVIPYTEGIRAVDFICDAHAISDKYY